MNPILQQRSLGSWITLGHPAIAELMADAGFDWLAVDLEHSAITLREAEDLIRVIERCGCTPLVRLSSNNAVQIKRVMDSGAHGVIVPMVNSEEDAKAAVAAVKYPPKGKRSFGLARTQRYGNRFAEYIDWATDNSIVIVQIEHIEAVGSIEQILAVPGVDGYFVGPYDLSGSMGIPGEFENPEFVETMRRIREAGLTSGKPGGRHVVTPDIEELARAFAEGERFVAYGLDVMMLDKACRAAIRLKKETE